MSLDDSFFKFVANEAIMGIAIFENTPEFVCSYMNPIAFETLEVNPKADIRKLDLKDFFSTVERKGYRKFSVDLLANEGMNQDVIIRKLNDQIFISDLGVKHIQTENGDYILLMFRDVTFQKKLQREVTLKQQEIQKAYEEILDQNKALLALDKAKDRFIALTTHELRTPLSAMIATSEILAMGLYDDEAQLKDFIQTIYEEGRHLLDIVNDILDFSKIQAGKMDFFIELLDLIPLVKRHVENFQSMGEAKGVEIIFTDEDKVGEVEGYIDPLRFGEIFSNVLNNAIKFTRANTPVSISIAEDDKFLFVNISDQGKGIPEEHKSSIFNEFETVANIKTHQKGTGLGMPISKRLAEGMGGDLLFESVVMKGTTFSIKLPKEKVLDESVYRRRPAYEDDLAA